MSLLRSLTFVQFLDTVVDLPVVVKVGWGSAENCGGPAVAVHRRGGFHVLVVVQRLVPGVEGGVRFLGALDGQQLLVVEGSGVPGSPGVYSQVTWHSVRATITTTTTRARTLKVAHSSGVAYRVCLLRSPWMVNATCAARALPDAAGSDGCAACRAADRR